MAGRNLKNRDQDPAKEFPGHIIDHQTKHLVLFFDEVWTKRSDTVSYGHDIEATWLLLEAAEAIHNQSQIDKVKAVCIAISEATLEG